MLGKTFDLAEAWEFVRHETLINKPTRAPYPQSIVKTRELLLTAQVLLENYEKENSVEKRKMIIETFNYTIQQYRKLKSVNN